MIQTKTGPALRTVKDELPDGRGYRLTFVPDLEQEPERPLLPLDPSDPKYLEMIADMVGKKLDMSEPDEPLFVYATEEGIAVLQEAGVSWAIDTLLNPGEVGARVFESGLIVGAKACSLLRIPKPEKAAHAARLLGNETDTVDYLKRFGVTERVSSALHAIAAQLTTCKLEAALVEYIAGKDFMLREYRKGVTLQEIQASAMDLAHDQDLGPFDMTKRQWLHWFDQFATEIAYVRELFFIVGYEKGEPYTQADFSLQRWLCSGVDAKTRRPCLTLVDQRPNLLGTPDSVMDPDDMVRSVRYRELMSRYRDDGTLALLRK